jgi:hypothetical protein
MYLFLDGKTEKHIIAETFVCVLLSSSIKRSAEIADLMQGT